MTTSMRAAIIAGVLLTTLALAACGGGSSSLSDPVAAPRLADPDEFALAIADASVVTINVHVPDEGALAQTDQSIPFDAIKARANELPADRTTPLAVYCMSGNMSAIAVDTLTELGYTNVVELDGGMLAWQAAGFDLLPPESG